MIYLPGFSSVYSFSLLAEFRRLWVSGATTNKRRRHGFYFVTGPKKGKKKRIIHIERTKELAFRSIIRDKKEVIRRSTPLLTTERGRQVRRSSQKIKSSTWSADVADGSRYDVKPGSRISKPEAPGGGAEWERKWRVPPPPSLFF